MCDEIDRRCNLDVIKERHLMKRSLGNSNKVDIGDEKFISCSLSPATAELVEHPQNEGSTLQSSSSTVRLVLHGWLSYLLCCVLRHSSVMSVHTFESSLHIMLGFSRDSESFSASGPTVGNSCNVSVRRPGGRPRDAHGNCLKMALHGDLSPLAAPRHPH